MRGRAFDAWFLAVADPARGAPAPPCPGGLEPRAFCDFADGHGVLPAVTRSLRRIEAPGLTALLAEAEERLRRRVGFALMLRKQLEPVAAAFAGAGLPAIVLKGQAFADHLYPEPFLRPFTDLDFLLPRDALAHAAPVLERLGYRRAREPRGKYPGQYGEETWRLDDPRMGAVELHWNLVNSPSLRRRCSVELADIELDEPEAGALPRPTASSLLLLAAVHAAAGHRFDRLQPLCDVVQAARGAAGPIDGDWLARVGRRTGSAFAMATALRLAGAAFGEPACAALAARVRPQASGSIVRRLITPRTVLRSKTVAAGLRRQLLRELLKRL